MTPAPEISGAAPVRILRLRLRGFRSYGTEPREVDLDAPLTVVRGDNSQGKTATAEAIEFLFTGSSSRRDLFGGAKAEYERMLANVHLPEGDTEVWVEADIRCSDGLVRTIRRALTADYSPTSECESELTIDGEKTSELGVLGIPFGEPPLAAPVLLQHNLRYVLSTEPNKRAAYFRSLLDLTDLDVVRNAVSRAKDRVASLPPLPRATKLSTLADLARENPAALTAIRKVAKSKNQQELSKALVVAATALNPVVTSSSPDEAISSLRSAISFAEEKVFPIGALTPDMDRIPAPMVVDELAANIDTYQERLADVDAQVVRLTPIFAAVLNHQDFDALSELTPCPVCNDGVLGPDRIARMRNQLTMSSDVQEAARRVIEQLKLTLATVDRIVLELSSGLPQAVRWQDGRWTEVSAHRDALSAPENDSGAVLDWVDVARGYAARADVGMERLRGLRDQIKGLVGTAVRNAEERIEIEGDLAPLIAQTDACVATVANEMRGLRELVDELHEELGEKLQTAELPAGTRDVLDLLEHREELFEEQRVKDQRQKVKRRVEATGRVIQAAERAQLDNRFETMGDGISRWWATLRPEELVRFGGVDRRASGRRFVNLTAELGVSEDVPPQVRDAVGVFSDSQLNALGLSAFLARQQLLRSPVVILDDPIPGYDPDHQDTFAAFTVQALLEDRVQIILLSHNPALVSGVIGRHQHVDALHYRVSLPQALEGSLVTNEDDFFGRMLKEAKSHLTAKSEEGRKAASAALRRATERLAKQILAAARTNNGNQTTVASFQGKMLGDLIPQVIPYALVDDEPGKWNTIGTILNPGNHDAPVASEQSLGVALGDLRRISKDHSKHWGGLPR